MSIVALVVTLCVILLMLWLVQNYMPLPWKTPVLVIVVLLALLWLVTLMFPGVAGLRIGR